jgi:hypothetical protein
MQTNCEEALKTLDQIKTQLDS